MQNVTIMTFNIRYGTADCGPNRWENRRELVVNIIKEQNPMLLGLQEVLHFQLEYLLSSLPDYRKIGVGRTDGKTNGEYSPILYDATKFSVKEQDTFWLSDYPNISGSMTWGNDYPRVCTWGLFVEQHTSNRIYLYNVHLDHQSQKARERGVHLLVTRILEREENVPFIITGDFNAEEDNPAMLYLKGKKHSGEFLQAGLPNPVPMKDTYRVLHPNNDEAGTFNEYGQAKTEPRIDYILVPSGVDVRDVQILKNRKTGRYPSDHYPLFANISV